MEVDLVAAFATNPGRVLSRDDLLRLAPPRDDESNDRSIDHRVTRLRRKLEADPEHPQLIKTVRGVGYVHAGVIRPVDLQAVPRARLNLPSTKSHMDSIRFPYAFHIAFPPPFQQHAADPSARPTLHDTGVAEGGGGDFLDDSRQRIARCLTVPSPPSSRYCGRMSG